MPGAMEVRLDAVQGVTPPPDTFVGMRVGDVQKQSRFGATRTFRFPDPGDHRGSVGRIEVFKRIGSLTVDLTSNAEWEVPCHYPDFESMRVKLNVKSDEAWERPATREKRSKAKQRMDAANAYIQRYKLEELLADAMREVIRNKPDNPHRYLANYILDHAEDGVLPELPSKVSSSKHAPMPVERAAPAAPTPPPRPPSQPTRGEKLPPIQRQDLQKSLPPAEPPRPLKAAAPTTHSQEPASTTPPQNSMIAVSPPAWLLPTKEQVISSTSSGLPQAVLPMKWYYMSNFAGSVAPSVCSKLFPEKRKAVTEVQADTLQATRNQVRVALSEATCNGELKRTLQARAVNESVQASRNQLRGLLCEATRNGALERAFEARAFKPEPFKYRPSVGTWVALRLPKPEPPPEKPKFNMLPSVGTWLAGAPKGKHINKIQQEEYVGWAPRVNEPPFCHRVSVGTWLMKTPPTVARPWYLQSFDAGEDGEEGEFIGKLQGVIAEKDKELELLKAQLAAMK